MAVFNKPIRLVSCYDCKYFTWLYLGCVVGGQHGCRKGKGWDSLYYVECSSYKRKWWKFWVKS
jgi:hypothetical protein